MKTSVLLLAAIGAGLVVAVVACKKEPPANPQPFYPTDDAGPYVMGQAPEAGAPVVVVQPEAGPAEAAAPPPVAAVFDAAAQELLKAQLKKESTKHAPYMKTEGPIMGGMLSEGQTVEQQAMFNPGKCYTIIGTTLAGVTELDIQVTAATPLPTLNPVLAMDNMAGPMAIVGDHPNCYKNPLPIGMMVKITVKATKGAGVAGAQLYVK